MKESRAISLMKRPDIKTRTVSYECPNTLRLRYGYLQAYKDGKASVTAGLRKVVEVSLEKVEYV